VIGRTLSHYRVTAALGAGGMGEVYRATDTNLGRDVAIKVLPPEVAQDPERLGRFKREAHLLASLNHPTSPPSTGSRRRTGSPPPWPTQASWRFHVVVDWPSLLE
jgi:serine/threonine protein kinase